MTDKWTYTTENNSIKDENGREISPLHDDYERYRQTQLSPIDDDYCRYTQDVSPLDDDYCKYDLD